MHRGQRGWNGCHRCVNVINTSFVATKDFKKWNVSFWYIGMFIRSITSRCGKSFVERLVILSGTIITWRGCFTIIHPWRYVYWRKCIQENVFSIFGWVKFIKLEVFTPNCRNRFYEAIFFVLPFSYYEREFPFALCKHFRWGSKTSITFHIWNRRNRTGYLFTNLYAQFLLPLNKSYYTMILLYIWGGNWAWQNIEFFILFSLKIKDISKLHYNTSWIYFLRVRFINNQISFLYFGEFL